jgi:hypothetical protein
MANDSTSSRPPTPTSRNNNIPSTTEKERSLNFPMIPPLPSSLNLDKENQRQTQTSSRRPFQTRIESTAAATDAPNSNIKTAASGSHSLHSSGHRRRGLEASPPIKESALSTSSPFSSSHKQSHSHSRSQLRSPSVFPLASSSSSPTGISSNSALARRVLRYGETMESLFALDKECTDEHWKLARSLADGSAADDANVWLRILHLLAAKAQERHNIACKGKYIQYEMNMCMHGD